MTFFSAFDVHVFWPILLFYWLTLFTLTMRRQIMHMIKYRYVPFSFVKQRYDGKMPSSSDAMSTEDWGGACYIHVASCCSEVDAVTLCLLRKMVVKKSNWIPLKFGFELYFLFSSATNDLLSL
ncbi:hypothetical protein WN943_014209 [Citrus x changshan-huyou]